MNFEKGYIGVTSREWFEFLRDREITTNVNFWRKDTRKFKLAPGDPFFFLVKNPTGVQGERQVLGCGHFVKYEILGVAEAWANYGFGNGTNTREAFASNMQAMFQVEPEHAQIGCIILSDLQFFEQPIYLSQLGITFTNSTVSGKRITGQEAEQLLSNINPPVQDARLGYTEDDKSFPEGQAKLKTHLVRERNSEVIRLAKERFKRMHGKLICEVCQFDFKARYGRIGEDYIEGHHTKPVSELQEGEETRVEDIALVCSNCHKMLHRRRPWLTMGELRELLHTNS